MVSLYGFGSPSPWVFRTQPTKHSDQTTATRPIGSKNNSVVLMVSTPCATRRGPRLSLDSIDDCRQLVVAAARSRRSELASGSVCEMLLESGAVEHLAVQ